MVGELEIAKERGDDAVAVRGEIEVALEAVGGGDDVGGGGGAGGESGGDAVAGEGEGEELGVDAVQSGESGVGGFEEVEVDGERAVLDGGSEVAPRLRGVFKVESGESGERGEKIRRICPSRFQNLLQLTRQSRRKRRTHFELTLCSHSHWKSRDHQITNPIKRHFFFFGTELDWIRKPSFEISMETLNYQT